MLCGIWTPNVLEEEALVMHGTRRSILLLVATAVLTVGGVGAPASATTVCIEYLDGYRCEVFLEPRPKAPGNTRGMKMTITPNVLTSTNELSISAGRFTKGEIVRTWVYNIFGKGRMSELTNVHKANAKGRVAIAYAPSTTLYEPGWGTPYVCMRGERSLKLACAPFSIAEDGSGGAPAQSAPASAATSPAAPAPAATPKPSATGNCRDVGFTVLCTN